jgi:hypothetical protein
MARRKSLSLGEMAWAELKHRPSLVSVLVLTALLAVRTPVGVLKIRADVLAPLVFQVAGTIVGLALTAAGLASTFIVRLSEQVEEVYVDKNFSKEERGRVLINRASELKDGLLPAWRGSVFVLCAFLMSALALITPAAEIQVVPRLAAVSLDSLFAVGSLSFLVIGSLWFLPTVKFSFRVELLENIISSAEALRKSAAPTVEGLFRRAQALRNQRPQASYEEIRVELCEECTGRPFPPADKIAFSEADAKGPIEESSAGLGLVKRGIQERDWGEVCRGVVLSLEQIEQYETQRGNHEWHATGSAE